MSSLLGAFIFFFLSAPFGCFFLALWLCGSLPSHLFLGSGNPNTAPLHFFTLSLLRLLTQNVDFERKKKGNKKTTAENPCLPSSQRAPLLCAAFSLPAAEVGSATAGAGCGEALPARSPAGGLWGRPPSPLHRPPAPLCRAWGWGRAPGLRLRALPPARPLLGAACAAGLGGGRLCRTWAMKCSSDSSLPPSLPGGVKCKAAGGAVPCVCVWCACEWRSVAAVFPGACSLTPVAAPLTAPRPAPLPASAPASGSAKGSAPGSAPAAPWSGPAARAEAAPARREKVSVWGGSEAQSGGLQSGGAVPPAAAGGRLQPPAHNDRGEPGVTAPEPGRVGSGRAGGARRR